jgi:pimeloyl-ACP methyl ester carboxylesterase
LAYFPEAADPAAELFLTAPARRPAQPQEVALFARAERVELAFEGERLPVHVFGRGGRGAVLFPHGWGGSSHQLHGFVEPLLARGASVAAFDAPGHGEAPGSWLAIPRYARAIARVAEHVGPLAALLGHSMGAAAAAFSLGHGVAAERAVLIGPPASEYELFRAFARSLDIDDVQLELAARAVEHRACVSFAALDFAVGPSRSSHTDGKASFVAVV